VCHVYRWGHSSPYLRVSVAGFPRRISVNVLDASGEPIPGAEITWYVNGVNAGAGIRANGRSTLDVLDSSAKVAVQALYRGALIGPVKLAQDQQSYDFEFPVTIHPRWREFAMKHFPALIGVFFILLTLILAFVFGCPNTLQSRLLLATFALGAGGFGGEIAGFLRVNLSLLQKTKISAGGAMAVFIVLFFFEPAGSLALKGCEAQSAPRTASAR
jgi:hypothetical protein